MKNLEITLKITITLISFENNYCRNYFASTWLNLKWPLRRFGKAMEHSKILVEVGCWWKTESRTQTIWNKPPIFFSIHDNLWLVYERIKSLLYKPDTFRFRLKVCVAIENRVLNNWITNFGATFKVRLTGIWWYDHQFKLEWLNVSLVITSLVTTIIAYLSYVRIKNFSKEDHQFNLEMN